MLSPRSLKMKKKKKFSDNHIKIPMLEHLGFLSNFIEEKSNAFFVET